MYCFARCYDNQKSLFTAFPAALNDEDTDSSSNEEQDEDGQPRWLTEKEPSAAVHIFH